MKRLLILAILCASCTSTPVTPDPAPTTTQNGTSCSAQGTGNTVICTTATPSPSPSVPKCAKDTPRYQENMVQAEAGLISSQSRASYLVALTLALQRSGFKVSSGGTLPDDQIALKASDLFSETYDFWREDNTPHVLYETTCSPSIF